MTPTTAGTPKIRRVLGRSTEGRVGAGAEVGAGRVGSVVGRDAGSVRRGRAGAREGGEQCYPPGRLASGLRWWGRRVATTRNEPSPCLMGPSSHPLPFLAGVR